MCGNEKKSLGARAVRRMTDQFLVLAGQKGAGLSRCVRAHIAVMNNDSSSLVRLLNFSEDFWQTNCGVPLRIDRPTMVKWNSRHMTSFAEETGHSEVIFSLTTFVEFGSDSKTHAVDYCLFQTHTHRSMFLNLWGSYKRLLRHRHHILLIFLYTYDHEPFINGLSNCSVSHENKSFLRPGVHAILHVYWWKKCSRMPLSHGMSHDDPVLWVHARH